MIVDDPYMVRIEAMQQLGATGDAFRDLAKAWMPEGEKPCLRDLFAAILAPGIAVSFRADRTTADLYNRTAKEAYQFADAMLKARVV